MRTYEFVLPVTYKGEDFELPFEIVRGYTKRFIVQIGEVETVVEPDDHGELRAIVYNQEQFTNRLPKRGLLEAITSVIKELST